MTIDGQEFAARGHAALAEGRWSDAARAFAAALSTDESPHIAFGLASAQWWMGDTDAALRSWERAYVLHRRRGDADGAVMAAFYLCLAYEMSLGNRSAARGWLARATRAAGTAPDASGRGWLAVARADLALGDGNPRQAEAWARAAATEADATGDIDLELCAAGELGAALVEQGQFDDGEALLDEAMAGAFAGEGRDRDAVVLISCRTITAASRAGNLRRVIEWVAAADAFHRRYGSPHLFATCRAQYGAVLFAAGRWPEAEQELAAALRIGQGGEEAVRAAAVATLAELRLAQGRLDAARELVAPYGRHRGTALARSLVHLADGEAAFAVSLLRRAIRDVDTDSLGGARLLEALVQAELQAGAPARAEQAAATLAEASVAGRIPEIQARADRAAGQIALLHGRAEAAADRLEAAADSFAAAELPLESARARLLLATALAASSAAAAVGEARSALATFDRLGASRDADAASALLRSLGVRPTRPASTAIGLLTRRELEVLALVAEGLSNPQIADRLFITRKTVEHHVANVLAKTGLTGRAEAAAWAARHLPEADGAPLAALTAGATKEPQAGNR